MQEATSTSPGPKRSPRLVLLVDDDHDVRESMADALQDAGFRVQEAPDGAAALVILREGSPLPDVIVLDLMMPVMDGWQFREAQSRDARLAQVPVIVVSAMTQSARPLPGVAAFLKKPVSLEQLLGAVTRHSGDSHDH